MSTPYDDDIEPVDEANDADRAEQLATVEDDEYDDQVDLDAELEADDADVAEQSRSVPESEDDYPHS